MLCISPIFRGITKTSRQASYCLERSPTTTRGRECSLGGAIRRRNQSSFAKDSKSAHRIVARWRKWGRAQFPLWRISDAQSGLGRTVKSNHTGSETGNLTAQEVLLHLRFQKLALAPPFPFCQLAPIKTPASSLGTCITTIAAVGLAIGLALLGGMVAGRPLWAYLEFPPMTLYVEHAEFSWGVFVLMAAFILGVVLPFIARSIKCRNEWLLVVPKSVRHPFPWWGWLALACGVIVWGLAWTRFDWFKPMQGFTFGPLWFAYIVVVNAWTFKRSRRCMMIDRPRMFSAMFALSAAFWWYFEYLNRFVQNWYYEGIGELTPLSYFLFATIPFSTVLPAVLGTYELLKTFLWIGAGLDQFVKLRVRHGRVLAVALLVGASLGLAGLALWPDYLFSLLWTSPLIIVTSLKALAGADTVFTPVREGRWRNICLLALAALICGWFWEMWNFCSLAKWIYTVPFVGEFKIFEMPLLGFSGYLWFGIECAVIAEFVGFEVSQGSRNVATPAGQCEGQN